MWGKPLKSKTVHLHPGKVEVLLDGVEIKLTRYEFKILELLMSKSKWVFSRQQIIEGIMGEDYPVTERSVDTTLVSLRRKLGQYRNLIASIKGFGYKFIEQTEVVEESSL